MGAIDEMILRTSKEIIVKFIEMGRISPVAFSENFKNIYQTVSETVNTAHETPRKPETTPIEPKKQKAGKSKKSG